MKKAKLLTTLGAVALVGAIGIGSTFAYLSSTTGTVTNTFTVGQITAELKETGENTREDGTVGKDYTDIKPGDTLSKDPTVTIKANSEECYVFVKVTGLEATKGYFTIKTTNGEEVTTANLLDESKWVKVDGESSLDGIYRYTSVVEKSEADQKFTLFDKLVYDINDSGKSTGTDKLVIPNITVQSCAVQSANIVAPENGTVEDVALTTAKAAANW